jgi:hypothetical protein
LLKDSNSTIAYYFLDSNSSVRDLCSNIFRSIASQIIQHNPNLAVHVDTNYVGRGIPCSRTHLDELIPELLNTLEMTRIVIDGLDECAESDQKEILKHFRRLFALPGTRCKILFSSRNCPNIRAVLANVPTVSLSERKGKVEKDIKLFIRQSLSDLRKSWNASLIDDIEQKMLGKAAGKMLLLCLTNSYLLIED